MQNDEKFVNIVKDFTRVTDTIDFICCAIENESPMPNYIPVCNDALLTDQLGKICDTITRLRRRAL